MDRGYKSRVRLLDHGSLELSQIKPSDEGWYECKIILLDGKEDSSVNGSWVHLNVNTPPRIEHSSPKFLLLRQGDSVSLFCDGVGSPQPTISWSKDTQPLFSSLRVRLQGDHVNITNIQRSDGGVYMCTFTNMVGQISQLIKVVIEDEFQAHKSGM
ncbi:protein turtle homolog B-like [Liolophura sinensis]|uniref:protein turtle homolog B-like n=1 Tax=Liolophura sinensis TaxID=3198878 RepID=UPI0031589B8D